MGNLRDTKVCDVSKKLTWSRYLFMSKKGLFTFSMALETFLPNLPGGDFAQEIGLFSPLVLGWLFPLL